MVAATRPGHREKRHGKHQKQNKHFLRVYSPYLPLLIIIGLSFVLLSTPKTKPANVLAYSTQVTANDLLAKTNNQRLRNKKQPLHLNPQLNQAAQSKATDMTERNYWSHNTPEGKTPWTFIDITTYRYKKAGENLAYGFDNNTDVVVGWMNSPTHRENLLDNSYQDVGFGIANSTNYQNSGPETIVVAIYGMPETAPIATLATAQGVKAYTSSNLSNDEPSTKNITRATTLTKGYAPWNGTAIGFVLGLSIAMLLVKHSLAIRRAFKRGERFAVKHVLFDVTILSLAGLCIIFTQSSAFIR